MNALVQQPTHCQQSSMLQRVKGQHVQHLVQKLLIHLSTTAGSFTVKSNLDIYVHVCKDTQVQGTHKAVHVTLFTRQSQGSQQNLLCSSRPQAHPKPTATSIVTLSSRSITGHIRLRIMPGSA